MDGNGRWAKERGLPRTRGHEAGEDALFDCVEGAIELGIDWLSAYAFSTENWKRSPEEVAFLMRFTEGVMTPAAGRHGRARGAGEMGGAAPAALACGDPASGGGRAADRRRMTGSPCACASTTAVGRRSPTPLPALAEDVAQGRVSPKGVSEKVFARYLDEPEMPDVDLFIRTSGEQRISNFLLWQSAYAELMFTDTRWPEFDRLQLWEACLAYARRERRFGSADVSPDSED